MILYGDLGNYFDRPYERSPLDNTIICKKG